MHDVAFSGFIKFLENGLELGCSFRFIFGLNGRHEALERVLELSLEILIVHVVLTVLA